ncbi:hypothetical protein LSM04_001138 [Trypanosoma melophagium]|uniref:uncharacterized protein n=1 Tax=Trypanosoma melophagium TaxID=715481 RepID=UPI00351A5783|nr:hypothetical protein LSM04_001138 [Trypanosoma melophagium]
MNELRIFLLDCVIAVKENLLDWVHAFREMLVVCRGLALEIFKNTFLASLITFLTMLVLFFLFLGCLAVALIGSFAIRHYVLSNVPEGQVHPLDINIMPFETEPWLMRKLDRTFSQTSPLLEVTPHRFDSPVAVGPDDHTAIQMSSSFLEQAASLKMKLIKKYVHGTLATSTLIIPSLGHREVFPPGGGVSIESLFHQKKPMFNAMGTYDAKMQLVFVREDSGRDISMMLESSVLISDDSHLAQSVSSLDSLFKVTTSFTLTTGDKPNNWIFQTFKVCFQYSFYVPFLIYTSVSSFFLSTEFPLVDASTEVSVVAPVYNNFEPPMALQPRLRAINFTLYQHEGDVAKKAQLKRMHLHTSVQLSGLAFFFSAYSMSSFVVTALMLFTMCSTIALGILLGLGVVLLSWYMRKKHSSMYSDEYLDDNDDGGEEEEEKKEYNTVRHEMFTRSPLLPSFNDPKMFSSVPNSRRSSSSSFLYYEEIRGATGKERQLLALHAGRMSHSVDISPTAPREFGVQHSTSHESGRWFSLNDRAMELHALDEQLTIEEREVYKQSFELDRRLNTAEHRKTELLSHLTLLQDREALIKKQEEQLEEEEAGGERN